MKYDLMRNEMKLTRNTIQLKRNTIIYETKLKKQTILKNIVNTNDN